jgi:RNA polymerase sigma-70 factor (ECF subfamily)
MSDDRELLEGLRRRDPEAFKTCFDRYSDRLFRVAVSLLKDEDEAESVVQDAFIRLFEKLDDFEGRSSLGTWLYRVTYNGAIDRLRRRRPALYLDGADPLDETPTPVVLTDWRQWPERVLSQAEVAAELEKAIDGLPEMYRAVFVLREIEGLSTRETADVVDASAGTVKVRLHRARLFLRERLSESLTQQYGEIA